ncbi:MAG TPA: hypothetical protein VNJ71_08420 [Gemmatimonadales bacterium]|jgi:protein tyrosine phosphatase (PTP) superfamily phosphohydrolase (DUF442 family)|nr:hypothetical protein [Gemmatimonadales bacterium]
MPTLLEAIAGVPNACQILPSLVAGGQPSKMHLVRLRAAGCQLICDLRDPGERWFFDEAETVTGLGLEYVNVPVTPRTINDTTLERVRRLLRANGERGMFLHCAGGNRAGATLLPYLILDCELGEEDALTLAARAGLSSRDLLAWAMRYVQRMKDSERSGGG